MRQKRFPFDGLSEPVRIHEIEDIPLLTQACNFRKDVDYNLSKPKVNGFRLHSGSVHHLQQVIVCFTQMLPFSSIQRKEINREILAVMLEMQLQPFGIAMCFKQLRSGVDLRRDFAAF